MAIYQLITRRVDLGEPIDPRNLQFDLSNAEVFEFQNSREDSIVSASISFSFSEVRSHKSLLDHLKLDASAHMKFGLTKVGASLKWQNGLSFEEDIVVFVLTGQKLYSAQRQKGRLTFSEEGKKQWENLKKPEDFIQFHKATGTEIVTQIKRGNIISLVYFFKTSSSESAKALSASLNAKWTSGSANIDLESFYKTIDKNTVLKVEGFQSTALPESAESLATSSIDTIHPSVADIINTDPGNVPAIKSILTEVLKVVSVDDRNGSPVLEFTTANVWIIPEIRASLEALRNAEKLNATIDLEVDKLFNDFQKASSDILFFESMLSRVNDVDFTVDAKSLIKDQISTLKNYRTALLGELELLNEAQTRSEITNRKEIEVPSPPKVSDFVIGKLVIPMRWGSASEEPEGPFSNGTELTQFNFKTTMWPRFIFRFADFIKEIEILREVGNGLERQQVISRSQILDSVNKTDNFRNAWSISLITRNVFVPNALGISVAVESEKFKQLHILSEKEEKYYIKYTLVDGRHEKIFIGNPSKPATEANPSILPANTLLEANSERQVFNNPKFPILSDKSSSFLFSPSLVSASSNSTTTVKGFVEPVAANTFSSESFSSMSNEQLDYLSDSLKNLCKYKKQQNL